MRNWRWVREIQLAAVLGWMLLQPFQFVSARYVPDANWNPMWEVEYDADGNEVPEPTSGPDTGDADGDGLPNWHEALLGTEPGNPDSDNDLATDGDEVHIMGTDPLLADSDGNGVDDLTQWLLAQDVDGDGLIGSREAELGTSDADTDSDDDGWDDGVEDGGTFVHNGQSYTIHSDPADADSDDNGLGDLDQFLAIQDMNGDCDGDTLTNWQEAYSTFTKVRASDSDGDGLRDDYELATSRNGESKMATDPNLLDSDGDSIADGADQDSYFPSDWQSQLPPLVITTDAGLSAQVGAAFVAQLFSSGGSGGYVWSLESGSTLPYGFSLSVDEATQTCWITGTPPDAGTWSFAITVADSDGNTASKGFTLSVSAEPLPPPLPLTISTGSPLPGAYVGVAYDFGLGADGGSPPYTSWGISSGSLPSGLALSSDGRITGVPAETGSSSFALWVSDNAGQTATKDFSLTVGDTPPSLIITTPSPLPQAAAGSSYDEGITAANGSPPYTWSVSASSLPECLQLVSSTGRIEGTPSTSSIGTWVFTIQVSDSNSLSATADFSLAVGEPPPDMDNDGDGLPASLEAQLSDETGIAINDDSQTSNGNGYNDWYVYYFARVFPEDTIDADGDLIPAQLEAHLGTRDDDQDSDDDFRPDWWPYYQAVLQFSDIDDKDGDGLGAQLEEYWLHTSDSDTLIEGTTIPIGMDTDTDGLSDAQEWGNIAFSDPLLGDTDGDGLWDQAEAQAGTQGRDVDSDHDFVTDYEELVVFAQQGFSFNPLDPDSDDDDLPDYYEAPLQDTDGGGIPDALEVHWLLDKDNAVDEGWDIDSDGISNVEEYHIGFDISGTVYLVFDLDGDGMSNVWEIAHHLNPRDPRDAAEDPDGDWWLNVEECRNITDPTAANSLPPELDPANITLNRPSGPQWSADWDGDAVTNFDEAVTNNTNPRLPPAPPPPPSCTCGNTDCEGSACASSTWGPTCGCHPPSCGCVRSNCPGVGCNSTTWNSDCTCEYTGPPPSCGCGRPSCGGASCNFPDWQTTTCSCVVAPPPCTCGHTGCEGSSCTDANRNTPSCGCNPVINMCQCLHTGCEGAACTDPNRAGICGCHTAAPCTCGRDFCPASSGGTCPTAAPTCACSNPDPNNCNCQRQNCRPTTCESKNQAGGCTCAYQPPQTCDCLAADAGKCTCGTTKVCSNVPYAERCFVCACPYDPCGCIVSWECSGDCGDCVCSTPECPRYYCYCDAGCINPGVYASVTYHSTPFVNGHAASETAFHSFAVLVLGETSGAATIAAAVVHIMEAYSLITGLTNFIIEIDWSYEIYRIDDDGTKTVLESGQPNDEIGPCFPASGESAWTDFVSEYRQTVTDRQAVIESKRRAYEP